MPPRRFIPLLLLSLGTMACVGCARPVASAPTSTSGRCTRALWVDRLEGPWAFVGDPDQGMSLIHTSQLPAGVGEGDVLLDGRLDAPCARLWRLEIQRRRTRLSEQERTATEELRL